MNRTIPAEVLDLYRSAGPRARAHVRVRWRTCPFAELALRVPAAGRILDLGCGHGAFSLVLALDHPGRRVTGAEIDHDKLRAADAAARAALPLGRGVPEFRQIQSGELPGGPWDAIVIVDVLYLLPEAEQESLLRRAARALAPGGLLLVKETEGRGGGKALWNRLQETLAVRVLRITKGRAIHFLAPEVQAAWLASEGLAVETEPLDRGYPHPHYLITARRPSESP
jgi:2-polyprenyl-3-methyl-5-hydroxy-6-metoxy-1,4-benzoquinol methylase